MNMMKTERTCRRTGSRKSRRRYCNTRRVCRLMMRSPSPISRQAERCLHDGGEHQNPRSLAGEVAGAADLALETLQRRIDVGVDLRAGGRLAELRGCGQSRALRSRPPRALGTSCLHLTISGTQVNNARKASQQACPWRRPKRVGRHPMLAPKLFVFRGAGSLSTVNNPCCSRPFDRADIGALEIVAGHARNVVIKAAGIAEGLDRLCRAKQWPRSSRSVFRTSQRTWQLALMVRREIFAVGAAEIFTAIRLRRARGDDGYRALKATESKGNWMRMGDLHR